MMQYFQNSCLSFSVLFNHADCDIKINYKYVLLHNVRVTGFKRGGIAL